MRAARGGGTLRRMHGQTEFRYRDHKSEDHASALLFVGLWLIFASLITGAWGIMALAHASWLHENDLPGDNATVWGVVLLVAATIQGLSGLLVILDTRIGAWMGITITVIAVLLHLSVISAYPIWSIVSIAVDVIVIYILFAYRRRRRAG
jgi:hypothetical protein